ncbi:probable myosin-binding protein 5 [Rutidosis leptorrhynchoides]|uniref:probable myosin-binding protein 5 n=1 Tax=Rutidosis leptorrhynchoides TaxID=125765 RepID=UPI003A99A005
MATSKRSFKIFVVEEMGGFPQFLLWAILEWILIASLYIDGFIAFISSTFAKKFELQPPCVLCTRVDHALVGKDPSTYYNESICECHKKDISSLAYCHVHSKLSDIQNMCEGCLLSFATEKESETETNKSLLTSLQKNGNGFVDGDMKMVMMPIKTVNSNNNSNSKNDTMLDVNRCSCCGEPLIPKTSSKVFARSLSNVRTLTCFTPSWKNEDSRYTELKFVSDCEPDMQEYDFVVSVDAKNSDEMNDESCRTPNLSKSNKFFGIPLTDSVVSPRFSNKTLKKASSDKSDLLSELNDEALGEGDSSLQQLKKQARTDRKNLQLLQTELEEERSAAAVAANNAMAMITRLQAEKAAVQMEALQYQRMMEEQAEYDQEEIRILQDNVAKRDELIRVMESELEGYKEKYGAIKKVGSDECEVDADECYQELKSQSSSSFGDKSELQTPFGNEISSPFEKDVDENRSPFEGDNDEPGSLLGRDDDHDSESNSGRSVEDEIDDYEEPLLDFETEKHQLYGMLKNLENHIESSSLDDEWDDHEHHATDKENKATLKREVSLMRERLRVLEADSGFLKHTAMTLQKGEKGAELLTEIAQHLRKLRHAEITDGLDTIEEINEPQ